MEPTSQHPAGWYRITIDDEGLPIIEADDEDGAFYAQVTLEKLSQTKGSEGS